MGKMTYQTAQDECRFIMREQFYYKLNDKQCDALQYAVDNMRNRERRFKAENVARVIKILLIVCGILGVVTTAVYLAFTAGVVWGMLGVFVEMIICGVIAEHFV